MKNSIKIKPLNQKTFSPYGFVIGLDKIPKDKTKPTRFPNISIHDFQDGKPVVDIIYSNKRDLKVDKLEKHNNSTQTFISLNEGRFLIVVGKFLKSDFKKGIDLKNLEAFLSNGIQGVTLKADVWHCSPIPVDHSLILTIHHRSPDTDLTFEFNKLVETLEFDVKQINQHNNTY